MLPSSPKQELMRIAKFMARSGVCSRREAEALIAQKRVKLNGKVLSSPAINVSSQDKILFDDRPLPRIEPTRLFLYHKPSGLLTTHKDPEGRPTIFDNLPNNLPRVLSVGRLDYNTQGLLLLTNDGDLSRKLELPSTGWLRRYRVRAYGDLSQSDLDSLSRGISVDGVLYGSIEAELERRQGDNVWLTMSIREGKNREIKKVLESLGLQVNRLIRVSYGPFQLKHLGKGEVEEVRRRVLKDQLGTLLGSKQGKQ